MTQTPPLYKPGQRVRLGDTPRATAGFMATVVSSEWREYPNLPDYPGFNCYELRTDKPLHAAGVSENPHKCWRSEREIEIALLDILISQSGGTQDIHYSGGAYICFEYEGRMWAVDVWSNSLGEWHIKGGELGEKWVEPVELTQEEIKKYLVWCGME